MRALAVRANEGAVRVVGGRVARVVVLEQQWNTILLRVVGGGGGCIWGGVGSVAGNGAAVLGWGVWVVAGERGE